MSDLASTSEKDGVREAALELLTLLGDYMVVTSLTANDRWSAAVDRLRSALASPAPAESGGPVAVDLSRLGIEWSFCPECGGEEIRYEEGRHKQCANCGQEWFSDLDYRDVTAKNLRRLFAHPPAESAGSPSTSGVGVDEIVEALIDARNQIEYLHGRFQETGSGNAVMAQLDRVRKQLQSAAPASDSSRDTQPAFLSTDETKEVRS